MSSGWSGVWRRVVAPVVDVRAERPASDVLGFATNIPCGLVRSEPQKSRMSQVTVGCPLDESNLGHEPRLQPPHFTHLLRCDPSTPMSRLAVRQIYERTVGSL
jgi:hypothetical protein